MRQIIGTNSSAMSFHSQVEESSPLNHFFQAAKKAYGTKQAVEITRDFCLSSDKPYIWRAGMEFLYMNSYFHELKTLIAKNKQSTDTVNQQWGTIYELQIARLESKSPTFQLIEAVNHFQPDIPELKALKGFLEMWLCYDINEIERLGSCLMKQPDYIAGVEDEMMAKLLTTRLEEAQASYYWKRNELVLARKYAFDALISEYSQGRKAIIHDRLALSYIFDDYVQATMHIEEALKVADLYGDQQLYHKIRDKTVPFILAHFGYADYVTTEDKAEQAHLEIAKGNLAAAREILATLPLDTPFQKYYMGLALESKEMLMEAYNDFIGKSSDYFFSRLPLYALQKYT